MVLPRLARRSEHRAPFPAGAAPLQGQASKGMPVIDEPSPPEDLSDDEWGKRHFSDSPWPPGPGTLRLKFQSEGAHGEIGIPQVPGRTHGQAYLNEAERLAHAIEAAIKAKDRQRMYELVEQQPPTAEAIEILIYSMVINSSADIRREYAENLRSWGRAGGSKDKNRHKSEAIELYKVEQPKARSDNQAHERVREKLAAKYQDPPTVRTISTWCKSR